MIALLVIAAVAVLVAPVPAKIAVVSACLIPLFFAWVDRMTR